MSLRLGAFLFVCSTLVTYAAGYFAARSSHRLVLYSAGCIGRPDLHPDFRASNLDCETFERAESAQGSRTAWQVVYGPVTSLEERYRENIRLR